MGAFSESLRIPEERRAIILGRRGKVKTEIEKSTGARIIMGQEIRIEGEPLQAMKARDIVKAIGRGFSPEHALFLTDDEYQLEVISLGNEKPNTIKRLFGRVIGRDGATRKIIEKSTDTFISVYGKTVSIIGKAGDIRKAKHAVELLLEGRSHGYVYRRLLGARA